MKFNKKSTSLEEQVALLKSRGVTILQKYLGRFEIMFRSVLKKVASALKAPPNDVVSWVRSLVILRNRCAHHGRLWGYRFKIRPSRTPAMHRLQLGNDSVGALIFILHDLLSTDVPAQKEMTAAFNELILACPEDFENALGLPKGFKF